MEPRLRLDVGVRWCLSLWFNKPAGPERRTSLPPRSCNMTASVSLEQGASATNARSQRGLYKQWHDEKVLCVFPPHPPRDADRTCSHVKHRCWPLSWRCCCSSFNIIPRSQLGLLPTISSVGVTLSHGGKEGE